MEQTIMHSPTLESVIMVERVIEKYSGDLGKYQTWKKLPRKMMYQTFSVILDYLEKSNKIIIDKDEKIVWIWNPQLIKQLEEKGLIIGYSPAKNLKEHKAKYNYPSEKFTKNKA